MNIYKIRDNLEKYHLGVISASSTLVDFDLDIKDAVRKERRKEESTCYF